VFPSGAVGGYKNKTADRATPKVVH